ncbi:HipA domain-containing protein [Paenarthrobacter sp. YAF11_1]|uniref:HipA domain-containing protein n=1 Tax=Micrococcaceae TaxID=1268 RepID=UPI0037BE79A0
MDENSEDATADREQLFRRIVFNIVVNNTDDHLRNHGFLRHHTGWRLSPAFDVNPNPDVDGEHATSIDGATKRDDAMKALLAVADYFVESGKRDEIVSAVFESVMGWRDAARACRIPAAEIELFSPVFGTMPRT